MSGLSPHFAQVISRVAQHVVTLSLEDRHSEAIREVLRLQQVCESPQLALDLQLLLAKVLAHKAQQASYPQTEVQAALQAFKLAMLMCSSPVSLQSVKLLSVVCRDEPQPQQPTLDRKALLRSLLEDRRGVEAWEELDLFVSEPAVDEEELQRCTELLSIDQLKLLRLSLMVYSLSGRRLSPTGVKELVEVSPLADEITVDIDSTLQGSLTETGWVLHFEGDSASSGVESLSLRSPGFVQMGWEEFLQVQLLQVACTVTLYSHSFSCELTSPAGKVEGVLAQTDKLHLSFAPSLRPLKRVFYKPLKPCDREVLAVSAFISDTKVKQEFDLASYADELAEELHTSSPAPLHESCFSFLVNNFNLKALLLQSPLEYTGFLLLQLPQSRSPCTAASVKEAACIVQILQLFRDLIQAAQGFCDPLKFFELLSVKLSILLRQADEGVEESSWSQLVVLAYILGTALVYGEQGVTELLESLFLQRSIEQRQAVLALCCDNFPLLSNSAQQRLYECLEYPEDLQLLARHLVKVAQEADWLEYN